MDVFDPNAAIQHARQPVIDAIAQAFTLYGWPEITGRLFAQLFLDGFPRSQDELAELVGMSKATVSTNLRSLEALHLVHRVASPMESSNDSGGRPRVYYQAERDFMKVAQELLHHNARREIELVSRGVDESRRRLAELATQSDSTGSDALHATIQDDLSAMDKLQGYRRWGQRLLWMLQSAERMQRFVTGFWSAKGDEDNLGEIGRLGD